MTNEKRFSDSIGEEYDLFKLSLPHLDELETKAVEKFSAHFTKKTELIVLEIGFGTGITSQKILSDERVHLIAIDNEPIMRDQALIKLKTFPERRFELYTSEALEYLKQQPDDFFDSIISVWTLHNINKDARELILKEIYRTLKIGGIFVNGDKIAVSDKVEHEKHLDWQLQQFKVYEKINRPELKKEWTEHYLEDEKDERILYDKDFIKTCENLGFKEIKIENRHYMDAIASALK